MHRIETGYVSVAGHVLGGADPHEVEAAINDETSRIVVRSLCGE